MIRPPTAGSSAKDNKLNNDASSSLGNKDSLRPPSAQPLNQVQELHQNNRLKRPDTGNVYKKPPMNNMRNQNEDDDDLNQSNNS